MSGAITTADEAAWRAALPSERSVFGGVEFAAVQERYTGASARLVAAGSGAYPLFLRDLDSLPFEPPADILAAGARCDATSPPYTGPLTGGARNRELAAAARELFAAEGVISEFAHLHPWDADEAFYDPAVVVDDREIVWIDLEPGEDEIWERSLSRTVRKNCRRAEREGVRVREGSGEADVAALHRIYSATMDRNRALGGYRFSPELFRDLCETMPGHARIAVAELGGEVVAATLYLHDGDNVYSYLGGADHAHQHVRPTNAVVWETIRWARAAGKRRLVLGGGYAPGDGIMRFKSGFSPLRATLRLARVVHMREPLERLADAWAAYHRRPREEASFFPPHRTEPA